MSIRIPSTNAPTGQNARPIDLGPHLPMANYHAMERWNEERIHALALYCSDGRWGEAFDEFCHRHLSLPRYDRLAVPGGPAWLVESERGQHSSQATHTQMDFLVQAHQLERLVLVTHYGCAWYGHVLQKSPDECLEAQMQETLAAAKVLQGWYPQMRVDTYLAMRKESWISFHEIQSGKTVRV